MLLPPIPFTCLIWVFNIIHQSLLLCDLFLINKLQHSYVRSCLLLILIFYNFTHAQLEIFNIENMHWKMCQNKWDK